MILALACSLFISGGQREPVQIANAPKDTYSLVSRCDSSGIAFETAKGLVVLDPSGKVERVIPLTKGRKPLYIAEDGNLVSSPRFLLEENTGSSTEMFIGPNHRFFSRNSHIFASSGTVTYLGARSGCVFGDYEARSAIGISDAGDRIAYMRPSGYANNLQVATLTSGEWLMSGKFVSPYVKGIGSPGIASGHEDLLFLDDDHLIFIGGFISVRDRDAYLKWQETLVDFRKWKLKPDMGSVNECYLFVAEISTGATSAICKFSIGSSSEMKDPIENTMILSKDKAKLYLVAATHVLELDSKSIFNLIK